jgi:hypothetical protein
MFKGTQWLNGNYLLGWIMATAGENDWTRYLFGVGIIFYLVLPWFPVIYRRRSWYVGSLVVE